MSSISVYLIVRSASSLKSFNLLATMWYVRSKGGFTS